MLRHSALLNRAAHRLINPSITVNTRRLLVITDHLTHLPYNCRPARTRTLSTTSVTLKKMGDAQSGLQDTTAINRPGKIKLSEEEWKAKLTPEQFSVCRKHGTERAWTGDLLDNKKPGKYVCACCGTELFDSSTKFDSGSGWPSFFDTLKDKDVPDLPAVDTISDRSHGMVRTEVLCGKCDAHLGHVFNDGPRPTGLRYCMNSVCLKFVPRSKSSSEL